jgi:hypothetical protein
VRHLNRNKEALHARPIYVERREGETMVEVALQYNDTYTENVLAFANNINTVDGGTHVTGFRAALTSSLNDWARKAGILKGSDSNLSGDDVRVSVWGAVDPSGPVAARARAMRHPERVVFRGETFEPAAALSGADVFFYPLQPDHYGTAENALIEAMSIGLVPVVLNNAAERAIVRDGETGFIAGSIEQAASLLEMLLSSPETRERVSRNAVGQIAQTRTPDQSVRDFMIVWLGMLSKQPRRCDFRSTIGDSPAEWFVATQCLPGAKWKSPRQDGALPPSKGTLAHFESVFAGDVSLARLRR